LSLEQEQRNLARKESEMVTLQKKLAEKNSKYAAATKKANDALTAASRTRSESTRRSKLRTHESATKDALRYQSEISGIQNKIAAKQKEIQSSESKVVRESKKDALAKAKQTARESRQFSAELQSVNSTIIEHDARLGTLEELPHTVSVLYLSSSPTGVKPLRVDAEARDIYEAIRKSDHPQAIDFNSRWAVRQSDLLQALNETNPDVVHFSGHGAENGQLAFEDQFGKMALLDKERLATVIGAAAEKVRLLVFNACYSDQEAEKVLAHVDAVIGMTDSISDPAAMAFAAQLYSGIGFGLDLGRAFKQARAAIALVSPGEMNIPKLRVRDDFAAEDIVFVER
jgi:hypothetical protein